MSKQAEIGVWPVFEMNERDDLEFTGMWKVYDGLGGNSYGVFPTYRHAVNAAIDLDSAKYDGEADIGIMVAFRMPGDIRKGTCEDCTLPSGCCTECRSWYSIEETEKAWDDFFVGLGESPSYEPGG